MGPRVDTAQGTVEGVSRGAVAVFRGIPYAADVDGPRRFAAPGPAPSWAGVRSAAEAGPAAPQPAGPFAGVPGFTVTATGPDCLTVNVWTAAAPGDRLPVLVWVPGGGFAYGSGTQDIYDGTALAAAGAVVVTINYRLGALGFCHLAGVADGDDRFAANTGLLDQIAALRWVADTIDAFGGDPANVTVFGESAGAMSVATLLAMPAAGGLFHRAVAQSGAGHDVADAADGTRVARLLLAELGVGRAADVLDVPLDALLKAQEHVAAAEMAAFRPLAFRPVVDGTALPAGPTEAAAAGAAAAVPLLVGTNADEWRLFGVADPDAFSLDQAGLTARLRAALGEAAEPVLDAYRAALPGASPADLWFAVQTDRNFRVPAARLAEAHCRHVPDTFAYLFRWPSALEVLGSCHGLEIPFVFGTLEAPGMPGFVGQGPAVEALAAAVSGAWLAFAATGDPNGGSGHPAGGPAGGATLPPWPPYDTDRRATMCLGDPAEVVDDPDAARRRAWDGVL